MLKLGSIYSIYYLQWRTNIRIYGIVLWPGFEKTHILNIGAIQLSVVDRARLIYVISKVSQIPNAGKYSGLLLYRIFKNYAAVAVRKCYRTLHTNLISKYAVINWGINKEEDFSELDKKFQDKDLYEKARTDFLVKALNIANKRGVEKVKLEAGFVKPVIERVATPPLKPGTKPPPATGVAPAIPPTGTGNGEEGGGQEGYY